MDRPNLPYFPKYKRQSLDIVGANSMCEVLMSTEK